MKRTVATLAGIATLASIPALAQADSRSILAAVNYERQMAGIDSVVVRKDLDTGCSRHAAYMNANRLLTHQQTAGSPLFSTEGQWAGEHSVLARSSSGFTGNPWKSAPFHEFQVLHPWLRDTGLGVVGDYACMVTLGDRNAPNPGDIKLVTVPGAGQYTRPAEVAREAPFVPGDEVGLPQGTKTGPHLYVYAVGPSRFNDVYVQSAALTAMDDGAPVPVRWVDAASPRSGRYLDGGAIVIPTAPLREGVTYGLRVEAATTNPGGQRLLISRTTSFVTGPDESDLVEAPETNDTVTAASARPGGSGTPGNSKLPVVLGADGQAQLAVALAWSKKGLRARIRCESTTVRCTGPLRILVRRKGGKIQKLRFVARGGPLKVNLAPGRSIMRRVLLTDKRQRTSGRKRGFAIRWGGSMPVKAKAFK